MSVIKDLKFQYKIGDISSKIIYWNVGCFLFSLILFYQFKLGIFDFPNWIALSSNPSVLFYKPWTLLSYAFFHDGFGHLFFNMLVLNFSSRLFLTFFSTKQYIGLYVLSAVFAGISFVVGYYFLHLNASIVGASAAIMAVLVAVTTFRPLVDVRLLLIGNVKLWHITAVILILDLMQFRLENTGGHISHLSGAFFGFIFIKLLQNGVDLSKILTSFFDSFINLFSKKSKNPFQKVHRNYNLPIEKKVSKIVTKDKVQQQVDEILDKISQSGYDSLSKDEKEFLFKIGK
jgi:membrane associated rhomboid family serine protease